VSGPTAAGTGDRHDDPDEQLRVLRGELSRARHREQQLIDRLATAERERDLAQAELADSWEQLRALRRGGAGGPLRGVRRWLSS
jgi:hypothetical protein